MTPLKRINPFQLTASICLMLAALIGTSIWAERSGGSTFLPHGFCFTWIPSLLWLHVLSDALIAVAYFSIPVGLWHFVRKRPDLPFNWIFLLFGLFIVACGATHLLGIWNVWVPDYWLSGTVKAVTAAASVPTAVALWFLIPRALALPTTAQLQQTNDALEREVAMRRSVEAELRETQRELEKRVDDRTRELGDAVAHAQRSSAQAQAANRAKDEFISMLSHELRNPMAPIANAHKILERTQQLDPNGRTALETAMRQTAHLKRLVEDLLDVTRIAQRKIELKLERVDVAQAIGEVVQIAAPVAAERGQPFFVTVAPDAGTVLADPARLQQVLENLLSNAAKFTRRTDPIRVDVTGSDAFVEVRVADEGVGIDPASLPRIFDLFMQADTSLDRPHGGLGIGLAWVRSIVELHGGTVTAASAGKGEGASFTVRLPRTPPQREQRPRTRNDDEHPPTQAPS